MRIKHAIWIACAKPAPHALGRLASEQQLEEMIVADPRILSAEWMLIGRQETTPFYGCPITLRSPEEDEDDHTTG